MVKLEGPVEGLKQDDVARAMSKDGFSNCISYGSVEDVMGAGQEAGFNVRGRVLSTAPPPPPLVW